MKIKKFDEFINEAKIPLMRDVNEFITMTIDNAKKNKLLTIVKNHHGKPYEDTRWDLKDYQQFTKRRVIYKGNEIDIKVMYKDSRTALDNGLKFDLFIYGDTKIDQSFLDILGHTISIYGKVEFSIVPIKTTFSNDNCEAQITYSVTSKKADIIDENSIKNLPEFKELILLPYIKYVSTPKQEKRGTYAFELDRDHILNIKNINHIEIIQYIAYSTGYVRRSVTSPSPWNGEMETKVNPSGKFDPTSIDEWKGALDKCKSLLDKQLNAYVKDGAYVNKLHKIDHTKLTKQEQHKILMIGVESQINDKLRGIPKETIQKYVDPKIVDLSDTDKKHLEDLAKNRGLKWSYIEPYISDDIKHANRSRISIQKMKDI